MATSAIAPAKRNPPASDILLTVGEFEQMEFEFPVELVKGRIEPMPPPGTIHSIVCGNIFFLLSLWARQHNRGVAFSNDGGVVTQTNPDTVRGVDVGYFLWDSLPDDDVPSGALRVAPELAVEVLSPSDRWKNVLEKILEYLHCGVREVWIVDPVQRTVEIHQPELPPVYLTESETISRPDLLPEFSCRVSEFFTNLKKPSAGATP